ncbi:hypothetical protein ACIQXD_24670 [Streptomyces uncialis]|uniref:hypothetical protein n=1 Tax=Streptomyces uncialis TaxID=1048205 RepID=UPI0038249C98
MTTHRRYAHALTAISFLLAAGALYAAYQAYWLVAVAMAYSTALLAWGASRERAMGRRLQAEARHATRRADLDPLDAPPPLAPCCPLWYHSTTVHGSTCTRAIPAASAVSRQGNAA